MFLPVFDQINKVKMVKILSYEYGQHNDEFQHHQIISTLSHLGSDDLKFVAKILSCGANVLDVLLCHGFPFVSSEIFYFLIDVRKYEV